MTRNTIIILLIYIVTSNFSYGQNGVYPKIDSIVLSKMKEFRIVGLSIGIVKDGKILYTNGYGFTDIDNIHKVTFDTRFDVASISKVFTATAIMQLTEHGKLDLNKKVVDYLPEFKLKDERYKEITILNLLTHSSGLMWDNALKNKASDSTALHDFILSLDKTKLQFKPGEKFNGTTYSNTGFDLLGYIVQKLTNTPFQNYIYENVIGVSGMTTSTYSKNISLETLAQPLKLYGNSKEITKFNLFGEIKDVNPIFKYPNNPIIKWENYHLSSPEHYPSGFLNSNSKDLSNWIIENLKAYNNHGSKLITSNLIRSMWTLKRDIEGKKTSIGLGWWRYTDSTKGNYVFHVGREKGYSSTLRIYPEKNIGIVILSNAYYAYDEIWNEIPDLIIKAIENENNGR